MINGSTFGHSQRKVGGGYPVWLWVGGKETSGGKLEKIPAVGTLIPAGSLVCVDGAGGLVKSLATFEVAEAVTGESTTVKVVSAGDMPKLEKGMFVMKAPNSIADKGKGVAVGDVTDNGDGTASFTITAQALGTLAVGDILVAATAAGSSAQIYCVPTGLTQEDIYITEGVEAATVTSVYLGKIMEDRIQPIPQCVKDVLPQIKFQKGV